MIVYHMIDNGTSIYNCLDWKYMCLLPFTSTVCCQWWVSRIAKLPVILCTGQMNDISIQSSDFKFCAKDHLSAWLNWNYNRVLHYVCYFWFLSSKWRLLNWLLLRVLFLAFIYVLNKILKKVIMFLSDW